MYTLVCSEVEEITVFVMPSTLAARFKSVEVVFQPDAEGEFTYTKHCCFAAAATLPELRLYR